uniref:Uncharacterized protein n=1 Tax=Solanum tuberosum TaxID=4113 RepID=M1C1A2_SOLTU
MDKLMQLFGFSERAIPQVEVCDCCKKVQLPRSLHQQVTKGKQQVNFFCVGRAREIEI